MTGRSEDEMSVFSQPITEENLVQALTDHAHKIAVSVLSRPETGLNLAGDAQVRSKVKRANKVNGG